ncbi:MAG: hypothetical protein ACTSRZ_19900 [Promethearchaeota archaeon]
MIKNKYKEIFLCILSIFLFFVIRTYAKNYYIKIYPKYINIGDAVCIEFSGNGKNKDYKIRILSPLGNSYSLIPQKGAKERYKLIFKNTYDKGFLTDSWNYYKVELYDSNKQSLGHSSFFLKDKNKVLYFTVYVDDIGREGYLNENGEKWFKNIGGKINYGYQSDDSGGCPLKLILRKYNNKEDYIFHHYHSWRFTGNRIILKLYHFLRWSSYKHKINDFFGVKLRNRYFFIFFIFLFISSIFLYLYKKNKITKIGFIISFILFFYILTCTFSQSYVENQGRREIKLSDVEWNKRFLKKISKKFEEINLKYPEITRHGWNIPPKGLNEFYLTEMGVLADASFIYPNFEKSKKQHSKKNSGEILNKVVKYSYIWPAELSMPLPYYTNLNNDFNILWDKEEAHRGILEMPLTFRNICAYGFKDSDKKIIDLLPNGALISTYVHPAQDLRNLRKILSYIKKNYIISFINAREYLKIYLKYYPRPVLIDLSAKRAYWALLKENTITTITETNLIKFNNNIIHIDSVNDPPFLAIRGKKSNVIKLRKKYKLIGRIGRNIDLYKLIKNSKIGKSNE